MTSLRRDIADDKAVSDVLGSILLVGITVAVMVGLSLALFAMPGPPEKVHANVRISIDPGEGGWGTGDEQIRVSHLGGQPLLREGTRIIITFPGHTQIYDGNALLGPFEAGHLAIGQTWTGTTNIPEGQEVRVDVVDAHGNQQRILASARLQSGGSAVELCAGDTQPPQVVIWGQSPFDVSFATVGPVTIQSTITDNCAGVDINIAPHLFYRINDGSDPTWTDGGAMNPTGIAQWTATIPSHNWAALVGQTLQYYVGGMADLNGNVGDSVIRSDVIQAEDPCASDIAPPSVIVWTQTPSDVTTLTLGSVTVRVVVADDCSGVDQAIAPSLQYRVNDGTNPTYQTAAMALVDTNTWEGIIPDQVWALHAGKTLEYYVSGMTDLAGNVGDSMVRQDPIQVSLQYTYVNSFTATRGTVDNFANAQSGTDSGAFARITEAATLTGNVQSLSLSANGIASNPGSWVNPSFAFASNDQRASRLDVPRDNENPPRAAVRYDLQNPVGQTGAITGVSLRVEGQASGNNGQWELMGCISGGTCGARSGHLPASGGSDSTVTYDITSGAGKPSSVGATWTWTDLQNLRIDVGASKGSAAGHNMFIDHVFVVVTYEQQSYDANVRMNFVGVPVGVSQQLELRYRTAGDSFDVQVCQVFVAGSCTTWTTRGAVLDSTPFANWSYTLTGTEYNLGAPQVRFLDRTPAGTTQGNLDLDYVRVLTL